MDIYADWQQLRFANFKLAAHETVVKSSHLHLQIGNACVNTLGKFKKGNAGSAKMVMLCPERRQIGKEFKYDCRPAWNAD